MGLSGANLGKQLKGAATTPQPPGSAPGGARGPAEAKKAVKAAALKGKVRAMEEADYARKLADQTRKILLVRGRCACLRFCCLSTRVCTTRCTRNGCSRLLAPCTPRRHKQLKHQGIMGVQQKLQRARLSKRAVVAHCVCVSPALLLQERLRAEEELSRGHRAKLEAAWLRIMRMAKVETLRSEVEILAAQHERDCAHRDATLRMMFEDLLAAEEQYRVALHNHLRQMDRLIELQDARLTDLETEFEADLAALQAEFSAEMQALAAQHTVERRELRCRIAAITEQEEAKAAEAKHEHETTREELRNRSIDRIQELSRTLDDRIMVRGLMLRLWRVIGGG